VTLMVSRVHLDVRTRALEPELRRLIGFGAWALTQEPVSEAGWRWHILADPDDNEFCVLQPPASYWPG
jgi:Glyoxalase-like domain